ncbi:MAG: EAL domain-containing protein, partial [Oleibacter sp.]|nr:EAL domain-containing protein [Thalassolituus sp.]
PMVNMIRNTDSLLLNNNLAETSKGTSEVLHLEVLFAELQRNLTKYRNNADKQRTINAAFAIAFPDKGLIVNSQGVIDIILGSRKSMVKRLNNDLIGTPYTSWLSLHLVPIIQQQYDEAILTNEMVIREIVEDHRSLESRMVPLVQNIIGENKPAFLWLIRDITEIRQKQKTIEYQANFDPLTDLANRRRAMKKIEEYVAVAQTQQQWSSILFIDLDHFKNINDSLGHHVGDHLLIDMSKRLRTVAQSNDVIARLGGDEFLILAGDFKNSEAEAIDYAVNLGDQVLKLISKPFAIGINRFHLSASIGVATFPTVNCDANDLIRQADTAMYHAKGLGRARLCVYNQRMHEATSNRLILFNDLYQAILDEAFTLVFQPQYNDDGAVTGAEVLCRWINNGQSVYPDLFIEAAEETNLIIPLGTWLLEKSCDMLCSWHQRGLLPSSFKRLAINISPAQFTDDEFENILNNTTARFAIDPSMIELELTERLFVKDKELIRDKMKRLNESGFTFALDDFGTGYSSLSYLQQLPINKLKIDRSFVMDIHDLEHDANIVDAIIQLSANLHMDIIAEGVENETQRCYLSSRGCHNYQGYLFSHPLREAQFIECINTPDIPFK